MQRSNGIHDAEIAGVVYASGSNVSFDGSSVENQGPGGPSFTFNRNEGSLAVFEDCTVLFNQTSLERSSNCIHNCIPVSQVEVRGGEFSMLDCTWTGSALAHKCLDISDARVELHGTVFDGLTSPNYGRGLHAYNCTTHISECEFMGGVASAGDGGQPNNYGVGGAVLHFGGNLFVEDCDFHDCVGSLGAAIGGDGLFIVRDSSFHNNLAVGDWYNGGSYGGAILAERLIIEGCDFLNNVARTWRAGTSVQPRAKGGAIYASGPSEIRNCTFRDNDALSEPGFYPGLQFGGAVYALDSLDCEDCLFENNQAASLFLPQPFWQGDFDCLGGGLYLGAGGNLTRCEFVDNSTNRGTLDHPNRHRHGGALYLQSGALHVVDSRFANNSAEIGGAVFSDSTLPLQMERTVVSGNQVTDSSITLDVATGAAIEGLAVMVQCTLADHDFTASGGQLIGENSQLSSCIVWDNSPSDLPASATVDHSTVQGGHPGTANSDQDPLFWGAGDYHLLPASPAIDSGDPALLDPDGTRADMGALPFDTGHCGGLCAVPLGNVVCQSNANTTGAAADISAFGSNLVSDRFLMLSCTSVPAGACGYFLASETAAFVPLFGNSAGNLCLGDRLLRMHDQVQFAGAGERVGRMVDPNQLAYEHTILAGSQWHFQFWYRDACVTGSTSNTSHSVLVAFQ